MYDGYLCSSSATTISAVPVTIGESNLTIQAGSKAHIAGDKSPMYGVQNQVEIDKSPDISMNHLAAVVAFKIVNNTNGPININDIELLSQTPLVGNYTVNLKQIDDEGKINAPTKNDAEEVISPFTSIGNNPKSVKITTSETIGSETSVTFYFAICPNIIKLNTLKILVNGSEKVPQADDEITFEAGKITTLKLEVNPLSTPLDNDALTYTFTGRKYQENGTITKNILTLYNIENGQYVQIKQPTASININNNMNVPIYVLGDKKTSIIRIEGTGATLVNVLPAKFYASRWNDKPTAMRIKMLDVYWKGAISTEWLSIGNYSDLVGYLGITLSDGITPDDLAALGFGTSKLTFSGMIPNCGFDDRAIADSKVLMIDEERTSKILDNGVGGNIDTYLKIAGESANIDGLIDIFNNRHSTNDAKNTAAALYSFLLKKVGKKVGSERLAKWTVLPLLGLSPLKPEASLMERLRDAQFIVEIETCPFPGSTDQNPIVFWGLDVNLPGDE